MKKLVVRCLLWLLRCLLSLRYSIKVFGFQEVKKALRSSKEGILFLPNHPAHIDPMILMALLWRDFSPHPLVVEYIYRKPFLTNLLRLCGAVSIPSLETAINPMKQRRVTQAFQALIQKVENGASVLIYPAGRLRLESRDVIGGASGVAELIHALPRAQIVLIRTEGLWGSRFSAALTGKKADLGQGLLFGLKVLCKNLLFFTPRRSVTVHLTMAPKEFPRQAGRKEINAALENWYQNYAKRDERGGEALTLVSYSAWRQELPQIVSPKISTHQTIEIPDEIRQTVLAQLATITKRRVEQLDASLELIKDLGLDSLDLAEILEFLDRHYQVKGVAPSQLITIQDLLLTAKGEQPEMLTMPLPELGGWPNEQHRPPPLAPQGKTVPEAFLRVCDRFGSAPACVDPYRGVLSYHALKQRVLTLALYLRKLPDTYLGVLLPAAPAAYITVLACLFAGKIPVMLNWTLGERHISSVIQSAGLKRIFTSWEFVDRLPGVDFGQAENMLVYLEDIAHALSWRLKLSGVWQAYTKTEPLLQAFQVDKIAARDPAVLLFTSGTEGAPKGVPLSHENLLSNMRASLQVTPMASSDVFLGCLPPFHAFGFGPVGLLPLLSGIRVAYFPNPLDGASIAQVVHQWKASLICMTPAFIQRLLAKAKDEELQTIRLFVSGAEKASAKLFEEIQRRFPHSQMIEGYGITECAPIISINPIGAPHRGVGKPIPGTALRIVDLQAGQELPADQEGMILVRGPGVFEGYFHDHKLTPFVELRGEQWYRTGDLGFLDSSGSLHITGRLKRFIKVGGEMINLGSLEEHLITIGLKRGWKIHKEIPTLAICAQEKEDNRPQIILFATIPLTVEEANTALRDEGWSSLAKISEVRHIDTIPVLGSGKIDYVSLSKLVQ